MKGSTEELKQPRRSLKCIDDNFLPKLMDEPKRKCTLLNLMLMKNKGLVRDMKVKESLGYSDHEMMNSRS